MTIIKLGHYQQVPYFYNAIGIQSFSKIIVKLLKRKLVIHFYSIDLTFICLPLVSWSKIGGGEKVNDADDAETVSTMPSIL